MFRAEQKKQDFVLIRSKAAELVNKLMSFDSPFWDKSVTHCIMEIVDLNLQVWYLFANVIYPFWYGKHRSVHKRIGVRLNCFVAPQVAFFSLNSSIRIQLLSVSVFCNKNHTKR